MNKSILIACEHSGRVREAFRKYTPNVVSCDILPPMDGSPNHYQCDVEEILWTQDWAAVIAFPPCTHLSASGARWWAQKRADGRQQEAERFFRLFTKLKCPWAIENPVGLMNTKYRAPDQIFHPNQFGHGELKKTCLWLHKLPPLESTNVVSGRKQRIWLMGETKDRAMKRSLTYEGVAEAMADQWWPVIHEENYQ